jgi:hypothetical protein
VLEGWSRVLGWYDFAVKGDRHVVWDMAWSQKQNVETVRAQNGHSAKGQGSTGQSAGVERPVVKV